MDYIILEPWALAAESLADPTQRLAFWDAIEQFAVHGREPDPSDGIGVMAVAMCRRMLENRRNKVESGRSGGKKKAENAKQTASTSLAEGKQTASTSLAEGKQTASTSLAEATIKKDKKDKNDKKESSTARRRAVPTLQQVLDEAELYNWLSVLPGWTMDDLRNELTEVHAELCRAGWLDRNGNEVKNWRTYLQKVVSEKKILRARGAWTAAECLGPGMTEE